MEVISETPPPLPPKSKKVRQSLKKSLENGSTLPSTVQLKQNLIDKEFREKKSLTNGIDHNNTKNKKSNLQNSPKQINGFSNQNDKSNNLIKSESEPQRRFEFDGTTSLSNRIKKTPLDENDSSPLPTTKSTTVTAEVTGLQSSSSDDKSTNADSYRSNFSTALAKFVNGTESSFQQRNKSHSSVVGKIASAFSEPKTETGPRIITWAEKNKENKKSSKNQSTGPIFKINEWNKTDSVSQEDEFLYQNVSNSGTNYIEYKLNGIINKETKNKSGTNRKNHKKPTANQYVMNEDSSLEKSSDIGFQLGKNKNKGEEKTIIENWKSPRTSQIEVRQVKNKTVVKISINENIPNFGNSEIKSNDNKENHFKPVKIEESEFDDVINDYQYPDVVFHSKNNGSAVNEYAEPFSNTEKTQERKDTGNYQMPGQVYANIDKSKKKKNRKNSQAEENGSSVIEQNEQFYANVTNNSYGNKVFDNSNEQFYANLDDDEKTEERHYHNHPAKQEPVGDDDDDSEKVYANLNPDPESDQVYENQEFEILKNSKVTQSLIEKNPVPVLMKTTIKTEEPIIDEGIYENHEIYENDLNTYENTELQKNYVAKTQLILKEKSPKVSVIEGKSPKPCIRITVNKSEVSENQQKQFHQDGFSNNDEQFSPSDTFDSGTCSDLDSLPPPIPAKTKNGKVIVTISNNQRNEDDHVKITPKTDEIVKGAPEKIAQMDGETQLGHKRAESLTSSGVGVDSEESDGEQSNISCDSLNSNELNGLSMSEDHGYHTPNSENKTGSPVDGVDYQNISKTNTPSPELKQNGVTSAFTVYDSKKQYVEDGDTYENTDIIQQVANVAQKIKNLRSESAGIYLAKRIESTEDETYENFTMFDKKPVKKQAPQPPEKPKLTSFQKISESKKNRDNGEVQLLPKGLLQDIRSRNVRLSSAYPKGEKTEDVIKETPISKTIVNFNHLANNVKPIKGVTVRQLKKVKKNFVNDDKRPKVEEKTYEERKIEHNKCEKVTKICAMEIDTDKFYKFHLFENREEVNVDKNSNDDETFAGVKDYLNREKPAAITSAKGTIRGVKNRVKAGIATFLQMQENKSYKDKDAGKIVVYSTTMGIVRETYHKCLKVKQILRTLMVKFEERDVFMSTDAQDEIRERMKCDAILVPQVFVEGQHIGDAETIERLNESGELRKILKPYKSPDACSICQVCGGYRLLPCRVCKGSKKSIHRNNFTAEFVSLKCMNCDQVGLTKCHAC